MLPSKQSISFKGGAIIAREYGIPAVVGVTDATKLVAGGSRVTLDGTKGLVIIEENRVEEDQLTQ